MKKILVTGGCGYIGSHTIVDLIQNGFQVISADNYCRSSPDVLNGIERASGIRVKNYAVDLCNFDDLHAVFQENPDLNGIIHFAAYKAVGESMEKPLMYFENNLDSLLNILKCAGEFKVPHFVFSSSCTVYGNAKEIPVTEDSPLLPAQSAYGFTKQMGEHIVDQCHKSLGLKSTLLRYFNPVGAHPSNEIGEVPIGKPANLIPAITQTAIGKQPQLVVNGNDYPTRDGSCIRDYIHVSDIAHAHTLALNFLINSNKQTVCEIFNLGSGTGYTVLEVIQAFERVTGQKLNYVIGQKRAGDVVAIYANNEKAKEILHWIPKLSLNEMMSTAWNWELKMHNNENKGLHSNLN